jgi:hypothetical protein
MNSILKPISPSWWLAASLAFPAAVSAQSLTPSQIQQINSGLFRSNSQDFFEQGNRQLEMEIAALLRKTTTSKDKILEIDEKLLSELCHEDFQVSSRYFDNLNLAQATSLNRKLKEICRQK